MSTGLPSTELPAATTNSSKPQRILACILCQQRKVKCDRKYPCANCIKSRTQCVPATQLSRPRKRRFPERELLQRLREYEGLLRQNNVKFEPLHKDMSIGENGPAKTEDVSDSDEEQLGSGRAEKMSPATTGNSERVYEAKNILRAMGQEYRDNDQGSNSSVDGMQQTVLKSWGFLLDNEDSLLFGSRSGNVDISSFHPDPVQIFRLWQIYLDRVNPMLKVTHTPTLQGRIIEAASNLTNVAPDLEALMFSIYCISVYSLDDSECLSMFGAAKVELLTKYHFGCLQALMNSSFLRTNDRDCLTALYLYLVSVKQKCVPQTLSSMLGVAIRIAQRMGIHNEATLAKSTPFEAEMRRRLWWSLVLFDTRIGELADCKDATLGPTWDCKVPLNVNDSDFHPEMRDLPLAQAYPTESLFAVVRSELGDFVRHTMLHLDFTCPALKPLAKAYSPTGPGDSEVGSLEKLIHDRYLKHCDPENPIHFTAIWWTRGYITKCHFMEHHNRYSHASTPQTESQHDAAIGYAMRLLECDTMLSSSPLTKNYMWLINSYFPFPAYVQILQGLKRRPNSRYADHAWQVMSDNYEPHFLRHSEDDPRVKGFTTMVLQVWDAIAAGERGMVATPKIVQTLRSAAARMAEAERVRQAALGDVGSASAGTSDYSGGLDSQGLSYGSGMQDEWMVPYDLAPLPPLGIDANQLDWSAMDWNLGSTHVDTTGMPLPY